MYYLKRDDNVKAQNIIQVNVNIREFSLFFVIRFDFTDIFIRVYTFRAYSFKKSNPSIYHLIYQFFFLIDVIL